MAMHIRLVINYFLSIGLALYAIAFCYQLYRNFQFKFLLIYFYYLTAVTIYGFFAWTGEFINGCLFDASPLSGAAALKPLVCLIAYPFIPISVYLFIYLIHEFLNKKISLPVNILYWSLWILVSLGIFWGTREFLNSQQQYVFSAVHRTAGMLMLVLRYAVLNHLFFHLSSIREDKKFPMAKFFGFYYVFAFTAYFIATHFAPDIFVFNFAWPLVFFFLNFPPLLFLKNYLYQYHIERFIEMSHDQKLSLFFHCYDFSLREEEIIRLVLNGKNHRQIENLLFISLGTVKNYTSNIYKKLGVKNRFQLINMIQNIHLS
jgi:DNA-binding CsgD family transcriptional regulator